MSAPFVMIGTSGWQYRDWRGPVYEKRMAASRWLQAHSQAFATVEVNASFYRLPTRETTAAWAARTPSDYKFTIKASRYLTHIRRLQEPQEPVALLLDRIEPLEGKLGPILVQLPPDLRPELDRLAETLRCFGGRAVAVEPRHPGWTDAQRLPALRALLADHGAALVWADRKEQSLLPEIETTSWAFLRLHEGLGPWPSYTRAGLERWADRLAASETSTAWVYFNNDPTGAAVRDACTLARLLGERTVTVSRDPKSLPLPDPTPPVRRGGRERVAAR